MLGGGHSTVIVQPQYSYSTATVHPQYSHSKATVQSSREGHSSARMVPAAVSGAEPGDEFRLEEKDGGRQRFTVELEFGARPWPTLLTCIVRGPLPFLLSTHS